MNVVVMFDIGLRKVVEVLVEDGTKGDSSTPSVIEEVSEVHSNVTGERRMLVAVTSNNPRRAIRLAKDKIREIRRRVGIATRNIPWIFGYDWPLSPIMGDHIPIKTPVRFDRNTKKWVRA